MRGHAHDHGNTGIFPHAPPSLPPPSFRPQRSTFVHTFSHEVNLRILTGSHSLVMFDRRLEHLHAPGALDAAQGSASNTARPRPNSRLVPRFLLQSTRHDNQRHRVLDLTLISRELLLPIHLSHTSSFGVSVFGLQHLSLIHSYINSHNPPPPRDHSH